VATTRKSIRVEQELRGRFYRDVRAKSSTPYRTRFPDLDRRNTVINQRLEPEPVGDAPPKKSRLPPPHATRFPVNQSQEIFFGSGETAQDQALANSLPGASHRRLRLGTIKEFYTRTVPRNTNRCQPPAVATALGFAWATGILHPDLLSNPRRSKSAADRERDR
jgi:hypothetical protein